MLNFILNLIKLNTKNTTKLIIEFLRLLDMNKNSRLRKINDLKSQIKKLELAHVDKLQDETKLRDHVLGLLPKDIVEAIVNNENI